MTNLPRPNKNLGQHFLTEPKVISSIVTDFADVADAILEIGPGPGILTKDLSQHEKPFHVIEKDERFPELLKEFIPLENIHRQDALECDFPSFVQENYEAPQALWLVSNLPYNVGSPILVKALQCPSIKYMTLMFQREVADKVFAIDTRAGKAMNSLMALSQTYFHVELLCKVPPGCFSPPPKVDSAVLSFRRREDTVLSLEEFGQFEKFLRHLFKFKRKQIGKVLSMITSSEKIDAALDKLSLKRNIRAEALELQTIQELYCSLKV